MKNKEIAEALIKIKAVELRPNKNDWFTWASGIKSPIYCDNRLTLSYPEIRKKIAISIAEIIKNNYDEVECIAGTATAGIPHAAWISDVLNLPMIYVRSSNKDHGKNNQIEGRVEVGKKVVLIEDLISTGISSVNAALALKDAGIEILAVISIFNYNLAKAEENFKKNNIKYESLTDYDTLMEIYNLSEEEKKLLTEWRNNL